MFPFSSKLLGPPIHSATFSICTDLIYIQAGQVESSSDQLCSHVLQVLQWDIAKHQTVLHVAPDADVSSC